MAGNYYKVKNIILKLNQEELLRHKITIVGGTVPRKSSFSTRIGKIAQTSCGDDPKGGDNREAEKNAYKNPQPK